MRRLKTIVFLCSGRYGALTNHSHVVSLCLYSLSQGASLKLENVTDVIWSSKSPFLHWGKFGNTVLQNYIKELKNDKNNTSVNFSWRWKNVYITRRLFSLNCSSAMNASCLQVYFEFSRMLPRLECRSSLPSLLNLWRNEVTSLCRLRIKAALLQTLLMWDP